MIGLCQEFKLATTNSSKRLDKLRVMRWGAQDQLVSSFRLEEGSLAERRAVPDGTFQADHSPQGTTMRDVGKR